MPLAKSRRINVLGFLHSHGTRWPFVFEGCVDTAVVIACFDAFCLTFTPAWVELDNAPQHTSQAFKARLPEWE